MTRHDVIAALDGAHSWALQEMDDYEAAVLQALIDSLRAGFEEAWGLGNPDESTVWIIPAPKVRP